MIRLFFIVLISSNIILAMECESALHAIQPETSSQQAEIEYPQGIYLWHDTIKAFPHDLQRLFLQQLASDTLEPYVEIRRDKGFGNEFACGNSNESLLAYSSGSNCYILDLDTLVTNRIATTTTGTIDSLTFNNNDTLLTLAHGSCEFDQHFEHILVISNDRFWPSTKEAKEEAKQPRQGSIISSRHIHDHGNALRAALTTFTPENNILIMDTRGSVYKFDPYTNSSECLFLKKCDHKPMADCDHQVYYSTEQLPHQIIVMIYQPSNMTMRPEIFDTRTKTWSKPLGEKVFPYRGSATAVKGSKLFFRENIIDIESKEKKKLCDFELSHPAWSHCGHFIFGLRPGSWYENPPFIAGLKRTVRSLDRPSLIHYLTGALISSAPESIKGSDNIINSKFITMKVWEKCGNRQSLHIYKVKPYWKFLADYLERKLSFDQFIFILFLEDLYKQGLILTAQGVIIHPDPLVKIVAIQVGPSKHPCTFNVTLRKARAYNLLRTSSKRIITADVQKIEVTNTKAKLGKLSEKSITRLKAIWDSLTDGDRTILFDEYGTSL